MKGKLTDGNSGIRFDDSSFSVLLMSSLILKNKRHNSQLMFSIAKIKLMELPLRLTPSYWAFKVLHIGSVGRSG